MRLSTGVTFHWRKAFAIGLFATVSALLIAAGLTAQAQDYPSRPIKIIVPYPPGASTDLLSRLVGEELRKSLGQTIIVENRGGAGGLVGAEMLRQSAPDGYTLGLGTEATHVTSAIISKQMPYDPVAGFTPITIGSRSVMGIAVNTEVVPVTTLAGLIAYAKEHPGKVSYGTPGFGSPQHFTGEILKQLAGIDIVHVPYRGSAQATGDLIAGTIGMIISTMPPLAPYLQSSKIKILAIGDASRNPQIPNIPAADETIPGFTFSGWSAFFAPAGLPQPILKRLNAAFVAAVRSPEVAEKLQAQFLVPVGSTSEELADLIKTGIEHWSQVAAKAGLQKQ